MSKQLTLSAALAVLSMATFALTAGFPGSGTPHPGGSAEQPLIERSIGH